MDSADYLSDVTVNPKFVGLSLPLAPFAAHISSQRSKMFIGNLAQAMIVHGNEVARIQSGYENKYGRYCINPAARDHDVQILDIIPKFSQLSNENGPIHNPEYTVIYKDVETPEPIVDYFTIPDYVLLHSKFGYFTKKLNMHELRPDGFIPKDMKFVEAPNHDGNQYNLGVNARVCYMPLWGTTNDAFIISETLRKKLEYTEIDQKVIQIKSSEIPLNLYGDDDNYKPFPDIGEYVRDDGNLIATRELSENSLIADITAESLRTPNVHHDHVVQAIAGAQVIDVTIFINKSKFNDLKQISTYNQFAKYQDSMNVYYDNIIDAYRRYVREGYKISDHFSAHVTESMERSHRGEFRDLILACKKEDIDLIYLAITYAKTHSVTKGYKLTSRDGAKGVISDVWPEEDMPSYQCGSKVIHADLVITGESPFNRLNISQLYEQFINYASDVITQRCVDGVIGDYEQQYLYIIDYISTVRLNYGRMIDEMYGKSPELRAAFVQDVQKFGIYFHIPSFSASITPEMVLEVSRKFNIDHAPMWYYQYDENGRRYRIDIKTRGIIGSKYIMLLGKLPIDSLSAVGFSYVSQFKLPVKSTNNDVKQESTFGRTPCRYGEDETALETMSFGAMATTRLLGIYSNCPEAQNMLKYALLSDPYPTRLTHIAMSDEDIVKRAINVKIFNHLLAACGIRIQLKDKCQDVDYGS